MREVTAAPRYATARTPGRRSYGHAIAAVAEALGKPLQAWQRQVVDVGTELLEDGSWAYRTVVVHVQRQAGKTTLLGPKNLHRCVICHGAKTWLTAQTRQDGRDTWRDVAELVSRSPLAGLVSTRRSNGSEELAVLATGSSFRVFAPSEDALHGKANESVDVDEAWAFDAVTGLALEQAILPTFSTTGGQLWLTSTAGTANSTWLRGYVDRGRAAVAGGRNEGIAYFEWSLAPAEANEVTELLTAARAADVFGPEQEAAVDRVLDLVLAAHPGAYVRRDATRSAALSMPPGEFLRAYGNVWTLTADRVIADHLWAACRDDRQLAGGQLAHPDPGSLALAFAVSLDRSVSSIGAGWHVAGLQARDVVDERPGVSWLLERVEQLAARLKVREVGYAGGGPADDIADALERRGKVTVRRLTSTEYGVACAGTLQAINDLQLVHRGTTALDNAVAAAARRELGDRWAWSRRHSAAPIAGLEAMTVAGYVLDHAPAAAPAPVIVAGGTEEPAAPAYRQTATFLSV